MLRPLQEKVRGLSAFNLGTLSQPDVVEEQRTLTREYLSRFQGAHGRFLPSLSLLSPLPSAGLLC